jgi:hypothetical protein
MRELMETDASIKAAKGREARERICKHFNMDSKPGEWEGLYQKAMAGTTSNGGG